MLGADARTLRSRLQSAHVLPLWMVRHASWVRRRFELKGDGEAAFEHAFATGCRSELVEFAEADMIQEPA